MSDLTGKFGSFEDQITSNHTELMAALNTIAFALGAPPTGPLTTLDDVITALTQSNTILAGIRSDNSTFYAALLDVAGLINTNTDTLINNNSLNAQRTIAAIYATFCACTTTAPILAPPLDVTPTSLADEAKCRRIQFYLHVFGQWLNKIANYGNSASFVTGDAIGTLLGLAAAEAGIVATGAEVGAVAGPPGIVIGAIVGLVVGAIFTFGGSILIDYAEQYNASTFQHTLLLAMFAATNADEGYTAFSNAIGAEFSTIPAGILNAMFWTQWSNDIYADVPVVDDSAFDGSICAPSGGDCFTFDAILYSITSASGSGWGISETFASFVPSMDVGTSSGTVSFDPGVFYNGDLGGWTLTILSGACHLQWRADGIAGSGMFTVESDHSADPDVTYTMPTTGTWAFIANNVFSIKLCPPA